MTILIVSLLVLGVAVALITRLSKRDDTPVVVKETCATCDGSNTRCEQECMMEASLREIEYFDDEELDRFKGRDSDEYSDDEAEQFGEVLYTMRPTEVKDWTRSLTLRGINLPDQIKDEVFLLIDETFTSSPRQ